MAGPLVAIQVGVVSFVDEGTKPVLDAPRTAAASTPCSWPRRRAQGIVLSRKYSEMQFEHLAGAGDAPRELS
jgi:hypothetical protein